MSIFIFVFIVVFIVEAKPGVLTNMRRMKRCPDKHETDEKAS